MEKMGFSEEEMVVCKQLLEQYIIGLKNAVKGIENNVFDSLIQLEPERKKEMMTDMKLGMIIGAQLIKNPNLLFSFGDIK